jgi:hypothetical protein
MPATFVPNGNQSLLPLVGSLEEDLRKKEQPKKSSGECKFCGGDLVQDETTRGKVCDNCGRWPLTFSCC